jgi:hypothetical protein
LQQIPASKAPSRDNPFSAWPTCAIGPQPESASSDSANTNEEISEGPSDDIIHRFQNVGEDVYRALRGTCSVSIEEIDRSMTSFVIRDVHRRDVGKVTQTIKRELRKNHFERDSDENMRSTKQHFEREHPTSSTIT